MKTSLLGAIAAMALSSLSASAVDLEVNYTPGGNYETYGLRGYIEYQDNGNAYPNFYVTYANFNSTTPEAAADGQKVIENADLAITVSGPDGFSWTGNTVSTPGFPAAESHAYCHLGVIKPGDYTMTVNMTLNPADTSVAKIEQTFTTSFNVPDLPPSLEFSGTLVSSDGTSARINYNAALLHSDIAATYEVSLYDNLQAEGTPVQTKTAAADGFDISDLTPGSHYAYAIKATVTGEGLDIAPVVRGFEWDQKAELPKLNFTITPTVQGADFDYTVSLGGYTEEQVQSVLICLLTGGEAFTDEAKYHSTSLSGKIAAAFDQAELAVWLKGELTLTNGDKVQLQPWDQQLGLKKEVVESNATYSIAVGDFERTDETSGLLDYTITVNGDINTIDYFEVWASRIGDENMNVTRVDKDQLTGKLNLTVLPANATTQIWPKVRAFYADGTKGSDVQTETTVSTVSETTPVLTLTVTGTTAETSITGYASYRFEGTNMDNVEKFVIFAVYPVNGTDFECGRMETTEAEGKLALHDLPANANTEIWVKGYCITKDGIQTEQLTYPGAAQGWNGLFINTINTDSRIIFNEVNLEDAQYYTLQGTRVQRPVKGQLYIVVTDGKSFRMVARD